MRTLSIPGALFALGLAFAALSARAQQHDASPAGRCDDATLRINDFTAIGTHNSYKLAIPPAEMERLRAFARATADTLDYAHAPLAAQLDAGARQLELDVYIDAEGERFSSPAALRLTKEAMPEDWLAEMRRPGLKVLHAPDVDFRSSCLRFIACLEIIERWSRAHPGHSPLLVLINAKDTPTRMPGATAVAAFDAAAFDALDAEIASVFARQRLVTPDEVQGAHATLREAAAAGAWPSLDGGRGRILFALDDAPAKVAAYRGARKSLEGRLMFVNTDESSPAAAYITLNDPIAEQDRIRRAVQNGLIVRTRADADTHEARRNDRSRFEAALASGAQYISTDYMSADPRFGPYAVRLPDAAIAVANAVRAPRCEGRRIE
jgi:hypothetical protein